MRLGEFCELAGKLAQYRGDRTLEDRPVRVERYAVARAVLAADAPYLLGQRPWSGPVASWSGEVQTSGGGRMAIHCDDWLAQEIEVPIPAPRNGKDYTWTWAGYSGWIKDYFRRCNYCSEWHDPTFFHCSRCGWAMKPQKHDVCASCRKGAQT